MSSLEGQDFTPPERLIASREVDVAVIGAGIAGSSLAKALADRGWRVALIDRRAFPRHKVCGEFLSPEAMGMLNELGLAHRIEALRPAVVRAARLTAYGAEPVRVPLPGTAWGLSRYALDETLHEQVRSAGAEVATGTSVTALRRGPQHFALGLKRDGRTELVRAHAVIGAWGGNGRIPGLAGAGRPKRETSPYMGVKSHFTGCTVSDEVELYFFAGGYLGLSPAGDGIVNAAALIDRRTCGTAPTTVQGWLELALTRCPALSRRLAGAVPIADSQAAVAPVRLYGKPVAWDGVPLVGDACVTIPPLCGDGMSMALRAAQLCAASADRYLKGELTMAAWEADYAHAVRAEFARPLRWGRLLQRVSAHPALARLALAAAARLPGLARRLVLATRLSGREAAADG
ncbi:NAD(P)/FAD-dependent oxidoreductase [Cohnella sp. 56]|uniref:NAD(P)/FAD-dependent oxidoreductase n=1 Tax=Cohnella sp. 56 TaxID=3113722 RepID=UPI0030E8D6F8